MSGVLTIFPGLTLPNLAMHAFLQNTSCMLHLASSFEGVNIQLGVHVFERLLHGSVLEHTTLQH